MTALRPRRRNPARAVRAVGICLVVLVVGWSALWFVLRWQAEQALDAWIAAERTQGRLWTCPGRTVSGFPLAITLRCEAPSFADARNPEFLGRIVSLTAAADLSAPATVAIDLTGPLTIRDNGADNGLAVSWAAARVTLQGTGPGVIDRGRLDAQGVSVALPRRTATRIGTAAVGFTPSPAGSAELTAAITDLRDPEADAVFGAADPIALDLTATLTNLPQAGGSLPTLLAAWQAAGGKLDVARFALTKGSFAARGTGTVELDAAHRVAGRLQAHFTGLEPMAARFGIPVAAVKVGGLLSSLLGGKAEPDQAIALDLPIVLRDGRLFIGPAKTALVLPPLY